MIFTIGKGVSAVVALVFMIVGVFFVSVSARAETGWEPQSTFTLSVNDCSKDGAPVQTVVNFTPVAGEQLGNFTLDGQPLTGDGNAPTAGPGEHTYTYTVTKEGYEPVTVSGTFTVEECPPDTVVIEVPAPPAATDPCGPNNASYPQPADTEQVQYSIDAQGNLHVTPKQGFAFAGDQDYVYPAPADSNVACPNPPVDPPVDPTDPVDPPVDPPTDNHPEQNTPDTTVDHNTSEQELGQEWVDPLMSTDVQLRASSPWNNPNFVLGSSMIAVSAMLIMGLAVAFVVSRVRRQKV